MKFLTKFDMEQSEEHFNKLTYESVDQMDYVHKIIERYNFDSILRDVYFRNIYTMTMTICISANLSWKSKQQDMDLCILEYYRLPR